MDDVEIIPAPLALKPEIEKLSRAVYEEHRARQPWAFPENGFDVTVQPNIDLAFQGSAKEIKASHSAFVAVQDGELAGYVILSPWIRPGGPDMPHVSIDDIAVAPAYRRQGVGRALLRHVADMAAMKDWDSVTANVWTGNQASAALFEAEGFAPASTKYRKGPDRQARDYPTASRETGGEVARLRPFLIFLLVAAGVALLLQLGG